MWQQDSDRQPHDNDSDHDDGPTNQHDGIIDYDNSVYRRDQRASDFDDGPTDNYNRPCVSDTRLGLRADRGYAHIRQSDRS